MSRNGRRPAHAGEIAVVGLSCRLPGARNIRQFWEVLAEGRETISFFTDRELQQEGIRPSEFRHPDYVKAKGVVDDIDGFDAEFFGYPPKEAERMDPQARVMHECAWEAFEDAGYDPGTFDGRVGVYLGANENEEWTRRVRRATLHTPEGVDAFLLTNRDYFATRLSYKLNLKGPSFTLLTACATSLVAVHLACQSLRAGECEMALAGAASLTLPGKRGYLYHEGLMVSSDGHCRTFDARADGTVFGDGCGAVLLKPLARALADRDHIYAVIRGSAINNDGNGKVGFTAPSAEGQATVIRAAHAAAGVHPESISYVEAHGTGTQQGDPVEFDALRRAFDTDRQGFCRVGSVKTNIGHVNVAAGVSSFVKTALALDRRSIPPTLHFEKPNPAVDLAASPFRINTELEAWERNGFPRRAGVSGFGFGGTNAHLILEEAPPREPVSDPGGPRLLPLSARTPEALEARGRELAAFLGEHPDTDLGDLSYTLSVGRRAFRHRATIVATTTPDAAKQLTRRLPRSEALDQRPVIFLFPGQGAQYVNMGLDLYREEPRFREAVDRCAEAVEPLLGLDLRNVLYPPSGDEAAATERLRRTELAQPAVFTISYALAQLWLAHGVRPQALVGHSIGECAAACIAGVLPVEDALRLLAERGKLMCALPPGRMLAVSLGQQELVPLLGEGLSIAAVNSPSLCVVAGPEKLTETLKRSLRRKRIASRYLATSHAFHSAAMDPIREPFCAIVDGLELRPQQLPILSTVTADWIEADEITRSEYWARNIRQTVRFSEAVQRLLGEMDGAFVEVGPGRALTTLIRMHGAEAAKRPLVASMRADEESGSDIAFWNSSLGKLWCSGAEVDWQGSFAGEKRGRISLPTYPFEHRRYWIEDDGGREGAVAMQDRLEIKAEDVADWFHVPTWKRSPLPAAVAGRVSRRESWLLFMDRRGVGEAIATRLEAEGRHVVRLHLGRRFRKLGDDAYAVHPDRLSDYDAFCNALRDTKRFPRRIVHLWTVGGSASGRTTHASAARYLNLGFSSLLHVAQLIGKENVSDEVRLHVVSDHLQDVSGDEKVAPAKSPLLGPVKVIPQEYANVRCCSVDVQLGKGTPRELARLADQLMPELRADTPDLIVAYRGDHRWIQGYEKVRLEKSLARKATIKDGAVVLITGGLGGIGLVFAEHLARTAGARLILTGRSKFPGRRSWDRWLADHRHNDPTSRKIRRLRKLERLGARVRVVVADVADGERMASEIARATKAFGPVDGVIHTAGVPGEGILQLKKPEDAAKVFSPKIDGTLVLDDLFRGTDLDFFVLCSSIASTLGGIGLGDYCAANSFLDAFATRRRLEGVPMVAINWDMWGQVGMGLKTEMPEELQGWFERELRNGITCREGVDVLRRVLGWPEVSQVIVSTRDLQTRVDLWLRRELIRQKEKAMKEGADRPRYSRPELSTDFDPPQTPTEESVAEIWSRLFGIDKVGRGDNFYELGGHSLLATSLLSEVRRQFQANVSIRDVLDHPSVAELASRIDEARSAVD